MTNQHPLTDEKALSLFSFERLIDTSEPISIEDAMRTASDWQLDQVIEWLKFGYQTDPNLSGERKRIGGFMEIAIALEQAMRPTTTQENN